MGFLYEGMTLTNILGLALFIAVLVGVEEVTRRSKNMSVAVYCVLPVILGVLAYMGILGSPTGKTWFGWVKVISALAGVWGFMAIRYTKLGDRRFAAIFPVSILSLNIAEAVYREFEVFSTYTTLTVDAGGSTIIGGYWNILNAVSGILCIVTLVGFVGVRVARDKSRDMVWPDMTWIYILAYTLWNYAYVYNCISIRSMYAGFGILTAALISEVLFKQGAWLQHRAQILSFYALFSLSFDYMRSPLLNITPTYNMGPMAAVSIIAFVFNVGAFAYMLYVCFRDRKNPLTEEIYVNTKYYQKSIKDNNLEGVPCPGGAGQSSLA